jgi:hypothetical protein
MILVLGELGGKDEYGLVEALKSGQVGGGWVWPGSWAAIGLGQGLGLGLAASWAVARGSAGLAGCGQVG